jgi:hypothetical protein
MLVFGTENFRKKEYGSGGVLVIVKVWMLGHVTVRRGMLHSRVYINEMY